MPTVVLYKPHTVPNYTADCIRVPRWTLLDLKNKLDLTDALLEWNSIVCWGLNFFPSPYPLVHLKHKSDLTTPVGDEARSFMKHMKHQSWPSELPGPTSVLSPNLQAGGPQGREVLKQVRPFVFLWPSTPWCICPGSSSSCLGLEGLYSQFRRLCGVCPDSVVWVPLIHYTLLL